nr:MAG TPA: baseplate protein [Caudoviricetes sp.]
MTKTFPEVISGIRTAKKGVEVREDIAQMGEYVEQFAATATQKAEAAAASEKKASDAVANIDQQKADSVAAVQQAQTTATTAITQTKDTALTDIDNAKTGALQEVASSTEAAQTAATKAKASEQAAEKSKEAAATSASTATTKASEASTSAGAASTSRQAAEKAQKAAEDAAELAGTRAGTDKTLSIENAPADAKATGDALVGKADKSIVQDENGNAIFYSKAEVEAKIKKILAAQREEDLARIKFWASNDPTSPASFIGGTWERIEDCTIWGASDTHPAGTKLEAGLPNITGYAYTRGVDSDSSTKQSVIFDDGAGGAFSVLNDVSEYTSFYDILTKNGKNNSAKLSFNASTSNPIYGASDTVQPPAYCMYIWRRVA